MCLILGWGRLGLYLSVFKVLIMIFFAKKIMVGGLFVTCSAFAQALDDVAAPVASSCCAMMKGMSTSFDYAGALMRSGIPSGAASFYVQAVNQSVPLVNTNARGAQNPASVIKLVTSFAALKTFGPDFHWTTQLLSEGSPDVAGVLHQPVYLKGSGDPQLVIEKIDELTQNLAKNGVKQVDAPIVVDRSIFKDERQDASSFDGEPSMPYNAQPDAALMNFRALIFRFDPETQQVTLTPWLMGYNLNNAVQWVDGACPSGGWKSTLALSVSGDQAYMGGKYYSGCGAQNWNFHAYQTTANDYVKGVFGGLMAGGGGMQPAYFVPPSNDLNPINLFAPPARSVWTQPRIEDGRTPVGAHVLASVQSAPLTDILRDMNHFSNNVMARQIYLSLSAKEKGVGNLDDSASIVTHRLAEQGLHLNSLRMGNGSGLSRETAVSAEDLGHMLVRASSDASFVNTLARLGIEGTVKNRLTHTDMVGRGRLKTGTLNDVRAIAGYIDGKSGARYAVVSIIQDGAAQTAAGKQVHDLFLQWVGEQ